MKSFPKALVHQHFGYRKHRNGFGGPKSVTETRLISASSSMACFDCVLCLFCAHSVDKLQHFSCVDTISGLTILIYRFY